MNLKGIDGNNNCESILFVCSVYSAGVVLSHCCAYYYTWLLLLFIWVLGVGHLQWKYFLYAITREFLIKQYSTYLIHGYCAMMLKRKIVVLAIFSSLKRNVFRPTQSGRSIIWLVLINCIFDFNVMLQNFWRQPFNTLVWPDPAQHQNVFHTRTWPGPAVFLVVPSLICINNTFSNTYMKI